VVSSSVRAIPFVFRPSKSDHNTLFAINIRRGKNARTPNNTAAANVPPIAGKGLFVNRFFGPGIKPVLTSNDNISYLGAL